MKLKLLLIPLVLALSFCSTTFADYIGQATGPELDYVHTTPGIAATNKAMVVDVNTNFSGMNLFGSTNILLKNLYFDSTNPIVNLNPFTLTTLQYWVTLFTNTDASLQTQITTETNRAYSTETNEAAIRNSGDTNLQAQITSETNRAYNAETNLQGQITAETNRAYIAETNLQAQITSETNRAYSAETNLQDQIRIETNRAYASETNLQHNIEVGTNTISTNLIALINNETNRAYSAETNLQAQITSETNRAYQAETNIQGQVDIVVARTNVSSYYNDKGYITNAATGVDASFTEGTSNDFRVTNGTNLSVIFKTNYSASVASGLPVILYDGNTTTVSNKLYQQISDKSWVLADNTTETNCRNVLGISAGTNSTSNGMIIFGTTGVTQTDLIVGQPIYVAGTAGEWTQTIPTTTGSIIKAIGFAQNTNVIYMGLVPTWAEVGDPSYDWANKPAITNLNMNDHSITNIGSNSIVFSDGTILSANSVRTLNTLTNGNTYPVFRIDVGLVDGNWTDFELKASTNNFTNMVYFIQSWTNSYQEYGDTNVLIYFTDDYSADVREWHQRTNNALCIGDNLTSTNSVVQWIYVFPSHNCSNDWSTWMYATNKNLIWSYVRADVIGQEMNVTGSKQRWNPIRPESWEVERTTP
jgi:hypothetical protein